jgi:hypothetical protein
MERPFPASKAQHYLCGTTNACREAEIPRVALPKGMLIAWQHTGGRTVSRVATLGLGGLFITTLDAPPVGTLLKLVFDVPGGEVRARAIVKNVKAGEGMPSCSSRWATQTAPGSINC